MFTDMQDDVNIGVHIANLEIIRWGPVHFNIFDLIPPFVVYLTRHSLIYKDRFDAKYCQPYKINMFLQYYLWYTKRSRITWKVEARVVLNNNHILQLNKTLLWVTKLRGSPRFKTSNTLETQCCVFEVITYWRVK